MVNWTRTNGQNYIRATQPHSTIGFNFTTSLGTVQLQYLRSAIFGLGSVKCWVDDDVEMAVTVIAYWKEIVNIGRYVFPLAERRIQLSSIIEQASWAMLWQLINRGMNIRTDLTPGDHILRCEVLEATADPGGGHEFRIISVMRCVYLWSCFISPFLPSSLSSSASLIRTIKLELIYSMWWQTFDVSVFPVSWHILRLHLDGAAFISFRNDMPTIMHIIKCTC